MRMKIIVPFSFLIILVIFGCSSRRVILPDDFHISTPASASKIPLRAGLYLPPAFKGFQFRFKAADGTGGGIPIELGDAVTAAAKISMREVFENVVTLQNIDSDLITKDIDIIIIPNIEFADALLRNLIPNTWVSFFICKWSIKGRDGNLLYVNTVTGEGQYKTLNSNNFAAPMVPALHDHFNKLTSDLLSVKWWENINTSDATH